MKEAKVGRIWGARGDGWGQAGGAGIQSQVSRSDLGHMCGSVSSETCVTLAITPHQTVSATSFGVRVDM